MAYQSFFFLNGLVGKRVIVIWLEEDPPPVNLGARHWNWVHAGAHPLRTPRRVKAGSDASWPAVGSETSFVS